MVDKILRNLDAKFYGHVCRCVIFFIAASVSFSGYYQKWHFAEADVPGDERRASFEGMVDGTADRPFVYRQLVPEIANFLNHVVSERTKNRLFRRQGSGAGSFLWAIANSPTAGNQAYFFRYLIVYFTTFFFTFLAVIAMYSVCRAFEVPKASAVLSSVLLIVLLPYIMSIGGYFYDYPELAFFALGVWVASRLDWWYEIPIAALGAWNKESFLLIIPTLYPLFRRRSSRVGALSAVLVLCSISATVYYVTRIKFGSNPGGMVEFQLPNQLRYFTHSWSFFLATEETYGVRTVSAFSLLPCTLLAWSVWRIFPRIPPAIRRHGQIAAAINLPLYFLFCSPGELRDLSMLYIFLLFVLAANLDSCSKSYPNYAEKC